LTEQAKGFSGSNLLTFDIEEWFHANYDQVPPDTGRGKGSNLRAQVAALLGMCSDTGCRATFFVLGSVAEDYPDVVKAIARAGHEVASHGYGHRLAYAQTFAEFKADVQKSVTILEDTCGSKVLGYRAPSWSIVAGNLHYLEALAELGLRYDASIFPVKTFLYGIPDAPARIHKPRVNGRELDLYEVPMSVLRLCGQNLGYSGGFYFRLFPLFLIKAAIRAANRRGECAIVYLHPREIDAAEQRLNLPRQQAFIHYHNVGGTKAKLQDVMTSFSFTSIAAHLGI
jgi:polysaccharide deacetylase family protein (PEP-CTERM system associated)